MIILIIEEGEQSIFRRDNIRLCLNIYQRAHTRCIYLRRLKEHTLFSTQQHNSRCTRLHEELSLLILLPRSPYMISRMGHT